MPTRFYDLVETNKKQTFTLTNIKQYPNAYNYILTMLVRPTARFNLDDYEDKSFNIVGSNELNSLLNVKGSIKSINPIRDDLLSNRIFLIESFIYTGYKGDVIKKYFTHYKLLTYFKPYLEKLEKQQTPEKLNVFIFNESHLKNLQKYIPKLEYSEIDFYDVYKI